MMKLFGQLNISKMSKHSELALSRFMFNQDVYLFALQETGHWDPDLTLFGNHKVFLNTPTPTEHLSGVALVINNKLQPEEIGDLSSADTDTVWCQIKFNGQRHLIGSAYCRPPAPKQSNSTNTPVEHLSHVFQNIEKAMEYANKHNFSSIRVYGDFNASFL